MNGPDLSSCRAKLSRAEAHIDALKREIRTWVDSHPYSLAKKTSPDLTRHGYVISVLREPDLEQWSLIAGDTIHNLRSTLDHLVYAIAVFQTKSDPPPGERVLAFPICDTPELFRKTQGKLAPLSMSVRAEIEGMQPYNRPHKRLPPLLGLLRDFDDRDKHRLLHVAMAGAWNAEWKNVDGSVLQPGESIEFFLRTAEVVDGAEIAAAIYPRPSPDLNHKLVTHIVISVEHRESPLGRTRSELADVLLELVEEVRTAIENVSAKS